MISAHIGLSYICNMNCRHCYIHEKMGYSKVVDSDLLLTKLEQLGVFSITYTMGETILYSGFETFAAEAKRRGFYQILLSNGSTIKDQDMIDKLWELGIRKTGISIDSIDPHRHDENRRYEGAYESAHKALRLIAKDGRIQGQVAMAIDSDNITEMQDVIEEFTKIGITSFSFLWKRVQGKVVEIADREVYRREMRNLFLRKEKQGIDINIHDARANEIIRQMAKEGEITWETKEDLLNMNVCHAFHELVLISPEGEVYPCNFSEASVMNIYKDPLEKIVEYQLPANSLCGGGTKYVFE